MLCTRPSASESGQDMLAGKTQAVAALEQKKQVNAQQKKKPTIQQKKKPTAQQKNKPKTEKKMRKMEKVKKTERIKVESWKKPKGGTQVYHKWISDWRAETGGSLEDGRAAWKALGTAGKTAAKLAARRYDL